MKFILTIIILIVFKSNSSFAESKKTYCKFSFKESVYTTIYSCSPKDITITKKEYDKISSQIRKKMNERRNKFEKRRVRLTKQSVRDRSTRSTRSILNNSYFEEKVKEKKCYERETKKSIEKCIKGVRNLIIARQTAFSQNHQGGAAPSSQNNQINNNGQRQSYQIYDPVRERILNGMGWTQINPIRERTLNGMGFTQRSCSTSSSFC